LTLATTTRKTIALGNDATTIFNYNFKIQNTGQMVVLYTDADGNSSILAVGTYTVAGAGSASGGTVTYPLSGSPIATGTKLTMYRSVLVQQLTKLINQGSYNPEVVEAALDYLTMIEQQIIETVGRAIVVPIDDVNPVVELPGQEQRSNAGAGGLAMGFDANGDITLLAGLGALTVSGFMTTFVTKTTAALGRAYLESGATGDLLFKAATAAAARSTLGSGAAGDALFLTATALAARQAIAAIGSGPQYGENLGLAASGASNAITVALKGADGNKQPYSP